jgi:MFS family permease
MLQRNFCFLWLGQALILCAVQFWVVALTWLVLKTTHSGTAIGSVLMVAAIPRGILTLVGGVVIDRFIPNRVAASAAFAVTMLVGICTALLLFNSLQLPQIIIISALFGASDAFIYPALMTILPRIVDKSQLASANAIIGGGEQITNVIGPAVSGIVVGNFGLPAAFAINTILFALGSIFLYLIRQPKSRYLAQLETGQNFRSEIMEGLRYAWRNPIIRLCLIVAAMLNFALLGPLVVGGAKLVEVRFGGDAIQFGYFLAAYGVGAILGIIIAGAIGQINHIGMMLVWLSFALGAGLIALGFTDKITIAYFILAAMGLGGGIVGVFAITWLQEQTEMHMQGRVMSLIAFASIALDPFSQAISGFLIDVSLSLLFAAAGTLMVFTGVLAWTSPAARLK